MAPSIHTTARDLAFLRQESLRQVAIVLGVAIYLWYLILFPLVEGFGPAFAGPALATVGLIAAMLVMGQRPSLAATMLLVGLALGILHTFWIGDVRIAPYLLAALVALTSLLFGMRAALWTTAASNLLILAIGVGRLGYPLASPELLAPVLVISTVGVASALSVRNLSTALAWAWERTQVAQGNEAELRERRAELARTVKALDEACERLQVMNYDLAQARQAADEARLLKQQFTTNVSHELRTPLNVIVAFSEMMYLSPEGYGGVPLPAEYLGDAREIYRASQHLLRLVDDVLDLSQIEAHRMKIRLEPVAPAEVVGEAIDFIRPLLRRKPVELRSELPPDLPPLPMDRARIRQVLLNLLNNARRFTEQGSITVSAALQGEELRFTVADTGVGIAPEDHSKVFEEFRQIETRQRDGSGLGLAISRRFVEMHGGRIWVESDGRPGQGSRFHFALPLRIGAIPEAGDLQRTPLTLAPPAGRAQKLLLVDDDANTRHLLEQCLPEYEVLAADGAASLPTLAAEQQPRALLLNPARGGRAWRQMRHLQRELGSGLPIVLCPLVGERQIGEALGVLDYLIKPISRASVAALLDRLGAGVRRVLIVDDDRQMAHVLSRMVNATGRDYQVTRAYGGARALSEMRRQRPDLVLLDLVMPEVDGYQVLAAMRQEAGLAGIPVAVITAQQQTPEEERRQGGGMFVVARPGGLTNEEALRCLRGVLSALQATAPIS